MKKIQLIKLYLLVIVFISGFVFVSQAQADVSTYTVETSVAAASNSVVKIGPDGYPRIAYTNGTNLIYLQCLNTTCSSKNSTTIHTSVDGNWFDMVLGSDGFGRLSVSNTNASLQFIQCTNASCSTRNTSAALDSGSLAGRYNSLTLNSSGNAVIAYYKGGNNDALLYTCSNASCSSGSTVTIYSAGNDGYSNDVHMGSDGYPRVQVYTATGSQIYYIQCTNASCSTRNTNGTQSNTSDGRMELASDDTARIILYDITNSDLLYVQCTNASCSTKNITTIDDSANDVGDNSEKGFRLDSNNYGLISYYDATAGDLKYIQCTNASCSTRNTTTIDSTGDVGSKSNMTLDSSGYPFITYYDATNSSLKLAICDNASCVSEGPSSGYTYMDAGSALGGGATDCYDDSAAPCPPNTPSISGQTQTSLTISWSASTGPSASSYNIQWCQGASCTPSTSINSVTSGYQHTGRTCNTTYRYRIVAVNASGSSQPSEIQSGTTSACVSVPTVTSPTVTSISQNGATLGGNVTSNGGGALTARGTCWGTTNPPNETNCQAASGTSTGVFTHARTGMSAGTLYYFRAYADNSAGRGYSTVSSFTTSSLLANGQNCSSGSQCSSGNCYVDSDNDRYAPSSGTKTCRANSQLSGTDCYDSNSNARPGQTSYFTTSRGDGSFDYNCVSGEEKNVNAPGLWSDYPGSITCKSGSDLGGWSGTLYGSSGPNSGSCNYGSTSYSGRVCSNVKGTNAACGEYYGSGTYGSGWWHPSSGCWGSSYKLVSGTVGCR